MRSGGAGAVRIVGVAAAVMAAATAIGCGGDGTRASCSAYSRRSCTGADGCQGESFCDGATLTWGACQCPDSGAPDGGSLPRLGGSCDADADCPTGAFCLQNDSHQLFGGAPPAGTCVAVCDPVSGCARFESATCIDVRDPTADADGGLSTGGLCFESCHVGGGAMTTAVPKCHGRAQVACAPVENASDGAGYCRPICATSGECLTGVCDPARGVCVTSAPTDPGFGLRCQATGPADGGAGSSGDAGAGADADAVDAGSDSSQADAAAAPRTLSCGGLCVGVSGSSAVCSRRCLFGSTDECAPEISANRRRGGCLFVTKGGGIGDLGYCAELCDCNGDCTETSFVCDAFDDANLEAAFARKGVCTPAELVVNRPLPCGN